jgi:hypothetical protein
LVELAGIYEIDVDYTSINDPSVVPSDHASFRRFGYPAILLTETPITPGGDFPNPLYRTTGDTANRLDPDLLHGNTLLTTAAALYLARIYTQGTISEPYPYGKVIAYPNPAYVGIDDKVTFGDILPPFTVEVFNLVGEEVFRYDGENQITCGWNLHCEGKPVAAGVYIYRVVSRRGVETGKLAVLK